MSNSKCIATLFFNNEAELRKGTWLLSQFPLAFVHIMYTFSVFGEKKRNVCIKCANVHIKCVYLWRAPAVECRPIALGRHIYRPTLGRYIGHHSVDISVDTRSTVGRVSRKSIDRHTCPGQ